MTGQRLLFSINMAFIIKSHLHHERSQNSCSIWSPPSLCQSSNSKSGGKTHLISGSFRCSGSWRDWPGLTVSNIKKLSTSCLTSYFQLQPRNNCQLWFIVAMTSGVKPQQTVPISSASTSPHCILCICTASLVVWQKWRCGSPISQICVLVSLSHFYESSVIQSWMRWWDTCQQQTFSCRQMLPTFLAGSQMWHHASLHW